MFEIQNYNWVRNSNQLLIYIASLENLAKLIVGLEHMGIVTKLCSVKK